jgi:hypothetical protein
MQLRLCWDTIFRCRFCEMAQILWVHSSKWHIILQFNHTFSLGGSDHQTALPTLTEIKQQIDCPLGIPLSRVGASLLFRGRIATEALSTSGGRRFQSTQAALDQGRSENWLQVRFCWSFQTTYIKKLNSPKASPSEITTVQEVHWVFVCGLDSLD